MKYSYLFCHEPASLQSRQKRSAWAHAKFSWLSSPSVFFCVFLYFNFLYMSALGKNRPSRAFGFYHKKQYLTSPFFQTRMRPCCEGKAGSSVLSRAVRERRDCVSAVRVRFLACASLQFSAENGRQPRKARKTMVPWLHAWFRAGSPRPMPANPYIIYSSFLISLWVNQGNQYIVIKCTPCQGQFEFLGLPSAGYSDII